MHEKKTGIRMRIFMVSILIFLTVMLSLYLYNIIRVNEKFIRDETKTSTECLYLGFDAVFEKFIGSGAVISIKNFASNDDSFETVSVMYGDEKITKDVKILPAQQKSILFEDLATQKTVAVFPNDCEKFAKTIRLSLG
ncbi:hypothetical protein GOV08_01720 [Candidatus Woesearchaeota archaeon]|nr:hypothetical protein [Candidatus Woesearchaeota archaeon]